MQSRGRLLLLVAACLARAALCAPARNAQDCVDASVLRVSGANLFPTTSHISSPAVTALQDKTTVQVAQNFEVTYYSTFKVVTNLYKYARESYVLYQCGTTPPDPVSYGLPNTTKALAVPLTSVSVHDTTVLYFLKQLGVQDRVSYVTSYAVDPCMQWLAGGDCQRTPDKAAAGDVDGTFVGFNVDPNDPTAIAFTATSDPGSLNRAEYIKYVATFFNREAAANAAFNGVLAAYTATKQLAANWLAAGKGTAPLVAWLYYQPLYDTPTYKAPPQMVLYFNAYRRQFTEDAGGRLHNLAELEATYGNGKSVTVSNNQLVLTDLPNTLPVLRAILKDVDVVIDESYYDGKDPLAITLDDFRTLYGLTDEAAMTEMAFLRGQRLLRQDGSANPGGTTSWYEEAVARPDEILRDLVSAFLPGALAAANDAAPARLVRSMFAASPPGRVVLSAKEDCPAASRTCGGAALQPICPAVYVDCSGKLVAATAAVPCAPKCVIKDTGGVTVTSSPNAAVRAAVAAVPMLLLAAVAAVMAALLGRTAA